MLLHKTDFSIVTAEITNGTTSYPAKGEDVDSIKSTIVNVTFTLQVNGKLSTSTLPVDVVTKKEFISMHGDLGLIYGSNCVICDRVTLYSVITVLGDMGYKIPPAVVIRGIEEAVSNHLDE